jgi:aspartate oxidase
VLVITKDLTGGASPLAQGGLAAAIGPGDTAAAHARDTEIAGVGLCEPGIVAALAAGSPDAVQWLVTVGAKLERRALRLEGGHSANRVVHSGTDATGAEVHRALLEALLTSGIEILDRTIALDLLPGGSPAPGDPSPSARSAGDPSAGDPSPRRLDVTFSALEGGRRDIEGVGKRGDAGAIAGLAVASIGAGGALSPGLVTARAVILAAGGLGQAYATTTNPAGATGDALAIAARAGAVLRDPEFVQFHPTVLYLPGATGPGRSVGAGWSGGQRPLITEALRGAGAVLRDLDGRPLMAGHHPRGDLAPRDVVAARVHSVITGAPGAGVSGGGASGAGAFGDGVPGDGAYGGGVSSDGAFGDGVPGEGAYGGGAGHVWLDATALGADVLENGFPTVTAACRKYDIDPVTDLIPVAPGAHYSCGGIRADLDGRTSIPGLYAIGEAASTGVHGANRLASNSLVEAIIAGRRAGATAAATGASTATAPERMDGPCIRSEAYGWAIHLPALGMADASERDVESSREAAGDARAALASAMSRYAGVLRDAPGLERLLRIIDNRFTEDERFSEEWMRQPPRKTGVDAAATPFTSGMDAAATPCPAGVETLTLADVEAANLRAVSALIAAAALRRAESRGAHRRSDATGTEARARHTLARYENAHDSARDENARDENAHDSAPGHAGRIHLDWEDL